VSYDPELNTAYNGIVQPYPWIAEMRGTLPKKNGMENNALYSDSTRRCGARTLPIVDRRPTGTPIDTLESSIAQVAPCGGAAVGGAQPNRTRCGRERHEQ
jgi:hypothetical protein